MQRADEDLQIAQQALHHLSCDNMLERLRSALSLLDPQISHPCRLWRKWVSFAQCDSSTCKLQEWGCTLDHKQNNIITFIISNFDHTPALEARIQKVLNRVDITGSVPPLLAALYRKSAPWLDFVFNFCTLDHTLRDIVPCIATTPLTFSLMHCPQHLFDTVLNKSVRCMYTVYGPFTRVNMCALAILCEKPSYVVSIVTALEASLAVHALYMAVIRGSHTQIEYLCSRFSFSYPLHIEHIVHYMVSQKYALKDTCLYQLMQSSMTYGVKTWIEQYGVCSMDPMDYCMLTGISLVATRQCSDILITDLVSLFMPRREKKTILTFIL